MSTEVSEEQASHSAHSLYSKLLEAFPTYTTDFESKWQSWQQAISPSSGPSNWSSVAQFAALKALGPKTIPAVLRKLMANYEDTTAVYLYNALEKDPEYLVDDDDLARQVDGILEKNFRRNRLIRNALLDWAEHCDMVSRQSSSVFYTECREYDQLVELGPIVLPHLMLQYKQKGGPLFAYELMHEIVWGHQTKQQTIFMDYQYKIWADWFEKKNHNQAPHYRDGKQIQ